MKKNLQELFEQYINEAQYSACLSPETIRGYKAVFNLFLKVMPEVTAAELLTNAMLNEFFKRIQVRQRIVGKNTLKSGVKKSTIRTQWSKLNVFFGWLYKGNYINENPLKHIKPPKAVYDDSKRLEDSEVRKLYSAITLHSINALILRRDTVMISLLLFCGLRKGEFISLQVRDIDLEKKEISIRGETSKSKKTRVLKIHPTLELHLIDYFKERNTCKFKTENLIISVRGDKGLTREGLKHWTKNLIKKSGIKFHLHRFRHSFACKLAEADVNVFKIQKMMGHANISMTMKYARSINTEDMANDIGKISI
ncbi:MAG: Phage integrase family protein [Chitinophagaceae bacterium]|nr:Phage integrase family protein [Chitinophagaceae bacterium]